MAINLLDLKGTSNVSLQIEKSGVVLKNVTGNVVVRNAGDTVDAEATASRLNASGNDVVINSDAAGAGADWKQTILRPVAGMTADVTFGLPALAGTVGQVLTVVSATENAYQTLPSTASAIKMDTTSFAFGTASPIALFSTGAGDILDKIVLYVDTAFDGTANVTVGVAGNTAKYSSTAQVDLLTAGRYEVSPVQGAQGIEALIATYVAGGATVGAARIVVHYGTPS